jgi:DNA-directed RNA polymerase specialized sigma24 family protein
MSSSNLPDDLGELVRLVQDCAWGRQVRDDAMRQLEPHIISLARRVCGLLPGKRREEFVTQSVGIVWQRLGAYDPARGRFQDWCHTVLHNQQVDQLRRASAGVVRAAPGGNDHLPMMHDIAAPVVVEEDDDQLLHLLRELRARLDALAWQPAQGVHHFAVLLLQLRLAVSRILAMPASGPRAIPPGMLAELAEWSLPWRDDEAAAWLRPGWPTLAASWQAFRRALQDAPGRIDTRFLCAVVSAVPPESPPLTPDLWNQWAHRAKQKARQRLRDDEAWNKLFGRLLPDR